MSVEKTEILDVIKEVRETKNKEDNLGRQRTKKGKDQNFEVFKEYNR